MPDRRRSLPPRAWVIERYLSPIPLPIPPAIQCRGNKGLCCFNQMNAWRSLSTLILNGALKLGRFPRDRGRIWTNGMFCGTVGSVEKNWRPSGESCKCDRHKLAVRSWEWCTLGEAGAREPTPSLQNLSAQRPPERSLVQIYPRRTIADLVRQEAVAGVRANARAVHKRLARPGPSESFGRILDQWHNRTIACPTLVSNADRSSQRLEYNVCI